MNMLKKELKYRFFSVLFLVVSAGILCMCYSSFLPQKWYTYAEPLPWQKFVYIELKTAYESGTITVYQLIDDGSGKVRTEQKKEGEEPEAVKLSLNQKEKKEILAVLKRMNPKYKKDEKLSMVEIVLGEKKVTEIARQLEHSMGNAIAKYLSKREKENSYFYLEEAYKNYLVERLDICTNLTVEEQLEAMENSVWDALNNRKYEVYQWGIGSEYPMFFGYCRSMEYTTKQLWDLWNILQEMEEVRASKTPKETLVFFDQAFARIDQMLGGDTRFAKEHRNFISSRKNTLQEEQEAFEKLLKSESYTHPYARYFCDYLGIVAGILPVLYAAFLFGKDRRSEVSSFIMVSPQKSIQIVGNRVLSIVLVFLFWFYLIATIATIYFGRIAYRFGYKMDYFAFFEYVTVWVVPTVLFTVALSVFLDLLFHNRMLVVLVQTVLFFLSVRELRGNYSLWKPIIRFNYIGQTDFYARSRTAILTNRGCIFLCSLLLFGASVWLYEWRRQGRNLPKLSLRFLAGKHNDTKLQYTISTTASHSWIYYQIKQAFSRNLFFALLFACFVGILFQGFGRDLEQVKRIGENYLSLSALFLFIPLCNIEKETNVYEVMCVQRRAYGTIYLIRVCVACILLGVVLAVPFLFFMLRLGYSPGVWCLGLYMSALFLGLLGLLVGEKTGSRRFGIAAILSYYVLCVSLKERFLYMSVCGYTYHIPNSKYDLLVGCIIEAILLLGLLLYRSYAKRRNL